MDNLSYSDESLLDFVNGKGITGEQFLAIVNAGYLQLSLKALQTLRILGGAVHPIEKKADIKNDQSV